MTNSQSLAHTRWECKYHVVWIPKYRRKRLFGEVRKELGPVLHELARQKQCEILEGTMMVDHVHMLIAIPPKYAVAQVVGYLKGKSAIHIARTFGGRQKNFTCSNGLRWEHNDRLKTRRQASYEASCRDRQSR